MRPRSVCFFRLHFISLFWTWRVDPELVAEPTNHIDDEYSKAGMRDPKILITTSRDPSSRLMQFAKVSNVLERTFSRADSYAGSSRKCGCASRTRSG